ncbi:MAG: hypothetical protein ABI743_10905, partial [bacterium]
DEYRLPWLALAQVDHPSGPADYATIKISNNLYQAGYNPSMAAIAGRLVISYRSLATAPDGLPRPIVWRALAPYPETPEDFAYNVMLDVPSVDFSPIPISDAGDRINLFVQVQGGVNYLHPDGPW